MLRHSEAIGKLAAAKSQAQGAFKSIGKDKSARVQMKSGGSYSYSYADLASCLDAVTEALSKAGLALFQPVTVESTGETPKVVATTLLVHGESGEWMSCDYEAPIVDANDARSVGSAATYARRYGLLSLLAIAPSEEDDDAEAARGGDRPMERTRPPQAQPRQRPQAARQTPDEPEMTQAEKARALVTSARDKEIFEQAIATGLSREGFHAWVEKMLGRAYSSNQDWTEDDRCHLEEEIIARVEAVKLMNGRETLQNSPRLNGGGKRPAPVEG